MTAASLVQNLSGQKARVVGHVDLPAEPSGQDRRDSDNFLADQAAAPWTGERLQRDLDRVIAEIAELQTANRWDDIIALFHPVAEKLPELADCGLADEVRLKVGFALCRAGRHDEALACLEPVTGTDPENALAHYTVAYTALDALFTARGMRQPMPPGEKKRLKAVAREHFDEACRLRPDSVTFFYRYGVLCKEIQGNTRRAIPLFEQAIANWEGKDAETRERQHQQYPKYIKAMYHLASCLLRESRPGRSLSLIERVIELDRDRDHMHPLFKHFAMAKVLHALGRPGDALQHLEVAVHRAESGQPLDFVHELAARCALAMGRLERAARHIGQVPAARRRPFVRWTEADILVARGRTEEALKVLAASAERDRRSRHKALVRMARIHLTRGRFAEAEQLSRDAVEFCRQCFGNPSHEAMFWQAAALYRLDRAGEALAIIEELEQLRFRYPNFARLAGLVRQAAARGRGLTLVSQEG